MKPLIINIYKDQMEYAELFGRPVLYTVEEIPRETVPEGWSCYDLCGNERHPHKPSVLMDRAAWGRLGSVLSPVPLKRASTEVRQIKDTLTLSGEMTDLGTFCQEHALPQVQDPRKYIPRPASPDEAGLFYALPPERDEELGAVGHVRMDFGRSGREFWHTWWPRGPEELNTPEFKDELGKVVDELRRSVLKDLSSMRRFCSVHGGEIEGGSCCQNYGFVIETDRYLYRLRCNPVQGDYAAYLACFDKQAQKQTFGLTEKGRQALQDAADPGKAHSYRWYVIENINDPDLRVDHDLPLEEAVQLYAGLDCADKRLGVTKDNIASVDLAIRYDGREWKSEDWTKLGSFRDDPVVAEAAALLRQTMEEQTAAQGQTIGGMDFCAETLDNKQFPHQEEQEIRYTIDEYLTRMEPVFRRQKAAVEKCIAGLTVHAAGLAAKGQDAGVSELGRFISDMTKFWGVETWEQHIAAFEQAVAAARDSGAAPMLTEQDKADIRAGLTLYAGEIRAVDPEMEHWAADCDRFAEALEGQWQAETSPSQDMTQINMELGGM